MEQNEILICQCHNTEHMLVFSYFSEEPYSEVYVHTHLVKLPFWKRLKYGIKYIFGYQSRYGAFDEIILKPIDADKVKRVYEYLKKAK